MLASICRLAAMLRRYRWALWFALTAAAVVLVGSIAGGADSQDSVLIALVAALWAVFLLALAHTFPAHGDTATGRASTIRARLLRRLRLVWQWILAVVAVTLGVALAWFTLRAAGVALG